MSSPGGRLVWVLLMVMTGGWVMACRGVGSSQRAPGAEQKSSRNVMAEADLSGLEELDFYQAIRRLRPLWLRYREQSVVAGRR